MPALILARVSAFAVAVCLASSAAADTVAQKWERIGDWNVSPIADGTCATVRDVSTGTRLFLTSNSNGVGAFTITNASWPMRKDQSYKVAIVLDGVRRGATVRGIENSGRFGIMVPVGPKYVSELSRGRTLALVGDDGRLMERIDLAGVAAAVARMRGCVHEVTNTMDRFASPPPPPPRPPEKSRLARPIVAPHALVTMMDYPAAALRAGEQGIVGFRLEVSKDGMSTGCTVASSSGSSNLDEATCRLMSERAKFQPARDASGKATTGSFAGRVVWRLEAEHLPAAEAPQ